ncbi:hypothetical protein AMATHDRAFT_1253 [Amanita thiersii Skay4041]|uniref:Piwi domain-containing protein n=1 Tax=Amanita thiersii Skay4041 TaxID=703135 RepID=A0A2A9NZQ5_9AGAR|nr:hypothetical protein AMATHDRAFT_1253 [Amanita thiersii Skay4041]
MTSQDRGKYRARGRGVFRGGLDSRSLRGGFPHVSGGGGGINRSRGFDSRNTRGRAGPPRGRGGASTGPVIYAEDIPAVVPDTNDAQNQLIETFKTVSYQNKRPLRPEYGTDGNIITLRANFFPVRLPKGPFYDYSVIVTEPNAPIEGSREGKAKKYASDNTGNSDNAQEAKINVSTRRRIFQLMKQQPLLLPFPSIAHDFSHRLVSATKLPQPLEVPVQYIEEGEITPGEGAQVYNVRIQFLKELDINGIISYTEGDLQQSAHQMQPTISALNLIFQAHASHAGVRLGKKESNGESKYFFGPGETTLAPGIEIWKGFFMSIRPVFKQLMVNVNVCYTAFMTPGNLGDSLLKLNVASKGAIPTLPHDIVASMKVKAQHLGYPKQLVAIGTKTARSETFYCEEFDEKVTVENYFRRKHGIKLEHPTDLPVVSLGLINKGGKKMHKWVPAEICDILEGSPRRGKLSEKEMGIMIRHASKPPRDNAETIVSQGLPDLGLSRDTSTLDSFSIKVDPNMAVIEGRVLDTPSVSYINDVPVQVRNGSWNMMDVRFQRGAVVSSWWVLYVEDGERMLQMSSMNAIANALQESCMKSGMIIQEPVILPLETIQLSLIADDDAVRRNALKTIRDKFQQQLTNHRKPDFVVILLEKTDQRIYSGIKRIGDVELGIHTVHMQINKVINQKKQVQYLANIALKVNIKLGGINHRLGGDAMNWLMKCPTMMVGIDVTHAGPQSKPGTPSIAAVVASIDEKFVQFPASLRIQKHARNKETLDELRDMLIERLLLYKEHNGRYPERILVFRDGVSESQFDQILEEELKQILEAFDKLSKNYKPLLSIVVCGKRHHARFFATKAGDGDRNGNTKPGTVVDKGVTAVFDFDFYLQAHAGIQGTVKSTHYTVIYDDTRFRANEIQKGIYDFSHLYARATKSVSLIPPAYYADLACERGRCYLHDFLDSQKDGKSGRSASSKAVSDAEKQKVYEAATKAWGKGLHSDMQNTMFYI